MSLCHIVPSLEDRHGGPSKSVRALANAMARLGRATELLTTLETGQSMRAPGDDAAAVAVFPREFPRWLCRSAGLRAHLREHRYDCVHAHALWLLTLRYAHEKAARDRVPLVISPRGMMSAWAWQHRRWRKRLADRFVHPGALAAAAGWHATSAEEADDIRRLGFAQPICVAPNGVEIPTPAELTAAREFWLQRCPALRGRRVAVFYSRYHRKKRVRELVELWAREQRADWFLLLVGVPEDYHAAEINGWISAAGARACAAAFDGTDTPAPFGVASLFVLPSHSENFGLVIAEALAAGVPALVSDGTPWQGLHAESAGWCAAWERWPAVLREALAWDDAALRARGEAGRAWMGRDFTWERSARRLVEFYRSLPHG
jgi:glycosyltransferase involved in cell wall biosynthesis